MERAKCPNCGSTSLYIPVSVMAKIRYNSYNVDNERIYGVNKAHIDNIFVNGITCNKCGWFGSEQELKRN